MGMVYVWKEKGAPVGVPAQIAGEELERIRTFNNGRLEAKMVVNAARKPTSPLHPAFEWNDSKAAEKWRSEQASHMIRHIQVVVQTADKEPAPTRAFVSVVRDEDRAYTSLGHALSDAELRHQVVRQAWAELEAWHRRYAELVEFAKLFSAIDQARPAVE